MDLGTAVFFEVGPVFWPSEFARCMVDRFFGEGRKPVFGVAIRVPEPPAFLIDRPESTEAARERMRGREDLFLGGVVYSPKAATSRTGFGSSAGDDASLLVLVLSELFFLAASA